MVTPFLPDGAIDYSAVEKMVEWYIRQGSTGIFAVCQSSEMFSLSAAEKRELARQVTRFAGGRIEVIASGDTETDPVKQYENIEGMAEAGVDAVVLVTNRYASPEEGEGVLLERIGGILAKYPEVCFGMYECPYPYKRLMSQEALRTLAQAGNMVFLKDTCCDIGLIRLRLDALRGTGLKLFNANSATLYDSLAYGAGGFSGVMGNFHPGLYRYIFDHISGAEESARLAADFTALASLMETAAYPACAKYHFNLLGIPMSTAVRTPGAKPLGDLDKRMAASLLALETLAYEKLGLDLY